MSGPHVVHVVESLEPCGTARQIEAIRTAAGDAMRHSIVRRGRGLAPLAAWRALREIRTSRPDVVHLWDDWALCEVGGGFTWGRGGPPIVVSLRHPRPPGTWFASRIRRRVLDRAARIVVGDEAVFADARAPAVSDRRTIVIPDGIERPAVESNARFRTEIRAGLGLGPTARLIGYAGRLVPHANVRDVIWLGMLLRVLHPEVRVVVVGSGPHADDLGRFADLVEFGEQTRFVGPRDDAAQIIAACDLYVDAARTEGPSPEIDAAQAAGVPVLCVDTPIRRRQIQADHTGYFFAEHDRATLVRRAHKLFSNPELYGRMSNAARTWSGRLPTPGDTAAAYAALYRNLRAGAGKDAP